MYITLLYIRHAPLTDSNHTPYLPRTAVNELWIKVIQMLVCQLRSAQLTVVTKYIHCHWDIEKVLKTAFFCLPQKMAGQAATVIFSTPAWAPAVSQQLLQFTSHGSQIWICWERWGEVLISLVEDQLATTTKFGIGGFWNQTLAAEKKSFQMNNSWLWAGAAWNLPQTTSNRFPVSDTTPLTNSSTFLVPWGIWEDKVSPSWAMLRAQQTDLHFCTILQNHRCFKRPFLFPQLTWKVQKDMIF